MKISNNGIELIKRHEGCKLKAYYCPSGVLTIGYGHTRTVYEGQIITNEEAEILLLDDIPRYYPEGEWNQNQFDSLTSFCFNCGRGALNDVLGSGDITGTMNLYNKDSDKEVLPGLVTRRREEIELFNTPVSTPIVKYQGHVQEIGWQDVKFNDQVCGTTGQALRLEALMLTYPGILFRAHIENLGWTNYRASGEMIGTIGNALRIESIEILSDKLEFSVHIEGTGWTDYKSNAVQGTVGQARRIEAIRIREI